MLSFLAFKLTKHLCTYIVSNSNTQVCNLTLLIAEFHRGLASQLLPSTQVLSNDSLNLKHIHCPPLSPSLVSLANSTSKGWWTPTLCITLNWSHPMLDRWGSPLVTSLKLQPTSHLQNQPSHQAFTLQAAHPPRSQSHSAKDLAESNTSTNIWFY